MIKLIYLSNKTGMSYEVVGKNYQVILNHIAVLMEMNAASEYKIEVEE